MGSDALLIISPLEDPAAVIERLQETEVTYFPRRSSHEAETVLKLGSQRYYGVDEILETLERKSHTDI